MSFELCTRLPRPGKRTDCSGVDPGNKIPRLPRRYTIQLREYFR